MIYHVGHYQRQLNLLPHVSDIGYIENKTEEVNKIFRSCNFSFILKGDGWYFFRGEKHKINAPAILLQWPGEKMSYGPDISWDEYFFIYNENNLELLQNAGVFNINRPFYPLEGITDTTLILNKIIQLAISKPAVFPVDQLDMLCWRGICQTPISEHSTHSPTEREKKLLLIAGQIKSDPLRIYDFKSIAADVGMSLPTFRRYWQQFIGVSPGRYIADLKLSMACKLLVESDKTIGEVSNSINIYDTLYFSRFFKKKTGLTPREYRYNHQLKKI